MLSLEECKGVEISERQRKLWAQFPFGPLKPQGKDGGKAQQGPPGDPVSPLIPLRGGFPFQTIKPPGLLLFLEIGRIQRTGAALLCYGCPSLWYPTS